MRGRFLKPQKIPAMCPFEFQRVPLNLKAERKLKRNIVEHPFQFWNFLLQCKSLFDWNVRTLFGWHVRTLLTFYGPPPLGEGVLWDWLGQYVSMSVCQLSFFSKSAHRMFLKLGVKLGCLKGRKVTEPDFWKKSHFGDNAQKYPKNDVFSILRKI